MGTESTGLKTVGVLGAGTVGTALAVCLRRRDYPVVAVASRSYSSAQTLAEGVEGCRAYPTLQDAAEDVHKDFAAKLKFARIWGSGKYDGVSVKRNHVLQDGDIIELHM